MQLIKYDNRELAMIYAFTEQDTSDSERAEIAQAIKDGNRDVIQQYVDEEIIIHVMDAQDTRGLSLYCIFCDDAVSPTRANPPKGYSALSPWCFKHNSNRACIGHVSVALSIENPPGHGCYICLGCENDYGKPTEWNRKKCKTINDGQTYCHLEEQHQCTV